MLHGNRQHYCKFHTESRHFSCCLIGAKIARNWMKFMRNKQNILLYIFLETPSIRQWTKYTQQIKEPSKISSLPLWCDYAFVNWKDECGSDAWWGENIEYPFPSLYIRFCTCKHLWTRWSLAEILSLHKHTHRDCRILIGISESTNSCFRLIVKSTNLSAFIQAWTEHSIQSQ